MLSHRRVRLAMKVTDAVPFIQLYRQFNKLLLLPVNGYDDELEAVVNRLGDTMDIMIQTPSGYNLTDHETEEWQESRDFIRAVTANPRIKGLVVSPMQMIYDLTDIQIHDSLEASIQGAYQGMLRSGRPVLIQNSSDAPDRLSYLRDVMVVSLLRHAKEPNLKMLWSPQNSLSWAANNTEIFKPLLNLLPPSVHSIRSPLMSDEALTLGGGPNSIAYFAEKMPKADVVVPIKTIKQFESEVLG